MILVILAAAALAYFFFAVLMQRGRSRRTGMWLSGALIILSVVTIAANDAFHFGLQPDTTTRTTPLVGVKAPRTLVKKPIGTAGKEATYLYRTNPLTKTIAVAKPSLHTSTHVIYGKIAQVRTATTRYRYAGDWSTFLFIGSGQDGMVKSRRVTFVVPANWHIVKATNR